jgi:PPK2 family polyphosphate:nucleotide phosphotransferase
VTKLPADLLRELAVAPGKAADLQSRDTRRTDTAWLGKPGKKDDKQVAEADLEQLKSELQRVQELLYANGTWSLLLVFQALDAAGKDGTIRHVMSGVNPQGCSVTSFKRPSDEDLRHDFLWRCGKALPERGHIGIFNRSYYEEVLVVRVHPDLLDGQHLPDTKPGKKLWQQRYDDINAFEQHLDRAGTRVVKFFLHVSKDEQKSRFLDRLDRPDKNWKFSPADLAERAYWDDYMDAYESALEATSTASAPWYVVPADNKWVTRSVVADILASTLRSLDLRVPDVSKSEREALAEARRELMGESG